jgi:hypothetical protein
MARLPFKCPTCNTKLCYTPYPDTDSSVDMFEAKCKNGHLWEISLELQDMSITITSLDDLDADYGD